VAVSPAEVSTFVQGGKLKTLAVMAEQRVKGFDKVPTLKERGIDLVIGTWRGIAAPKNTPPEVLATLRSTTAKIAQEPQLREAMERLNLGYAYADDQTFLAGMARDNAYFKTLMSKLNLKN
jgi:tripartite-type tricarboxylate transporter receptor subunit TctC